MRYKILFLSIFIGINLFSQKSFEIDLSVVSPCSENNIIRLEQQTYFYPNPTSGKIFLNSEMFEQAKIYALNGSLLITEEITQNNQAYDFTFLSKGMYFLVLIGEKQIWKSKLIVE